MHYTSIVAVYLHLMALILGVGPYSTLTRVSTALSRNNLELFMSLLSAVSTSAIILYSLSHTAGKNHLFWTVIREHFESNTTRW